MSNRPTGQNGSWGNYTSNYSYRSTCCTQKPAQKANSHSCAQCTFHTYKYQHACNTQLYHILKTHKHSHHSNEHWTANTKNYIRKHTNRKKHIKPRANANIHSRTQDCQTIKYLSLNDRERANQMHANIHTGVCRRLDFGDAIAPNLAPQVLHQPLEPRTPGALTFHCAKYAKTFSPS